MPQLIITYWRDMPAQVTIKEGRKTAKRPLPERFEQAIDMAAMRANKRDTDAYLAEWRKGAPVDLEGSDLEALADEWLAKVDTEFDQARLKELIEAGGLKV